MRRYRHQHSAPSCAATTSLLLATPFANFLTSPRQNVSRVVIEAKPTTMTMATTGGENLGKRSNRRLQPGKVETQNAYTEVQCRHWQRIAWNRDEDSSGGLDREEFFGFLNAISLDHFSEDSGGGGGGRSWQDIFNKMAAVSRIGEDTILQVSTDGFSSATATGQPQQEEDEAIDPKIEKEQQKYRDEFCKSVFEGMLDDGVEVETMDLAIFTYELFESPSVSLSDNSLTTTTTPTTDMSTATEFVTTIADEVSGDPEENLTASTSNVHDNSTITTLLTIGENSTTSTSPADEENLTTSISQDNSTVTASPDIVSTDESSPVSSTGSLPVNTTATIPTPATSTSFDKISFDESPPTTTIISPTTTTTASTILSTTDATKTSKYSTSLPATKSSSTTAVETIPESTTTSTSSTLPPFSPKVELASDIEKTIQIATSVEQVVIKSGGDGDSDVVNQIPQASTGMIVGVFAGVGSVVVLIVNAVTRHPYFDPSY
mmetsp:Transcript_939/g.2002  ORF Transcript_939/g.2002 Transcript_939/m.2002 type:complete len:491 (+) Transcript_939:72-1544(+)